MGLSLTDIMVALEEMYLSDNAIPEQIYKENPTLAQIPHLDTGGGKYEHVQMRHTLPQGRAVQFATSQANAAGSQRIAFDVPWVSNYQTFELDGNVLRDPKANKIMVIDHLEAEMDGSIRNLKADIGHSLFRSSGGSRGQRASVASSVITLTDFEDSYFFEKGMILQASLTNDGSGSVRAGSITVTSVDRTAGRIGFTGTITGFADNDYLFATGDYNTKMAGFAGWIPATSPGGTDSFFGVNRSAEPERLAGVRSTYSGTIAQRIRRLSALIRMNQMGNPCDTVTLNHIQWDVLADSLEGRKEIVEVPGKGAAAGIGFDAIRLDTPGGRVNVLADANCQPNVAWMLDSSSWCYKTVGKMVDIIDEDGLKILRKTGTDAYEGRLLSRGNIYCKHPGANGRAVLAAAT